MLQKRPPLCLILFSLEADSETVAFHDGRYRLAYEQFYTTAESNGLELCRAAIDWYDETSEQFSQAWRFKNGAWFLAGPVRPNIIYDKTSGSKDEDATLLRISKVFFIINTPSFTKIAGNKYQTSLLLKNFFKPYHKVGTAQELAQALKTAPGEVVVAKPEFGSGGTGIIIGTKKQLQEKVLRYPLLIQEFIDSSHGIPGITPGYHDLRLVFIDDKLVYSYIRIPKSGSLLANVAQGGTMEIVEQDALPSALKPLITDVQKVFAHFPRKVYTIDVMFDENKRPWIIELNTKPGIYFQDGQHHIRDYFYRALVKELKSLATEQSESS